jgi:hypothetical protein
VKRPGWTYRGDINPPYENTQKPPIIGRALKAEAYSQVAFDASSERFAIP